MPSHAIVLGFCWCFPADVTPAAGLALLRDAGYEAIELWPDALHRFGPAAWRRALDDAGMTCAQLCPYLDVVHGPVTTEMSRAVLRDALAAAAILSCSKIRTFTGPPWGPWMVGARDATPTQWTEAAAGMRALADLAAAAGVELCLECHEGSLMEDAPSTLRLLAAVDRSNLTVNLQLPLRDEPWQTSVAALGGRCTHVHIHNWRDGFGRGDWVRLSDGAGDWTAPLRAIRGANGNAPLCVSLEHANHDGRDPAQTARQDGPWLHALRDRVLA
jgi:sugar phosphate isomerase/epimerase